MINGIKITNDNIITLIQNGKLYLETVNCEESPIGDMDYNVLIYAGIKARKATLADIPYILAHRTKTVYVTPEIQPVANYLMGVTV